MRYVDALRTSMARLADNPKTIFVGQAVRYPGTAMFKTLDRVPEHQRLELPVAEDMQLGMSIGMAMDGLLPVSVFPRTGFLLCAANQLVNHLDKLPRMGWNPKVIIRTAIPTDDPLNPGAQHLDDLSDVFGLMLKTIKVVVSGSSADIISQYEDAIARDGSTLLIERMALYND